MLWLGKQGTGPGGGPYAVEHHRARLCSSSCAAGLCMQSLSLLRASNKGSAYQSASLIASIAHDTSGLYATALQRMDVFANSCPTPGAQRGCSSVASSAAAA